MNKNYLLLYQHYSTDGLRKAESEAGRFLVQKGFQQAFSISISNVPVSFGLHGKPYYEQYPDCHYNISHSHGLVAAVFSHQEIGLDLQLIDDAHEKIWKRVCTPQELAFLADSQNPELDFTTLWTQKESYLKYTGEGLSVPLQTLKIPTCIKQITCSPQAGYILTVTYADNDY